MTPPGVTGLRLLLPDTPLTPNTDPPEPGIRFRTSPEEYEKKARGQRIYFNELAAKIETGEANMSLLDSIMAAGAIRAFASQIPLTEPRGKGQLPKVDPGSVAMEFASLVVIKGMSKNAAHEKLAEKWDVSVPAIKKALTKYGDTALSWLQNLKR